VDVVRRRGNWKTERKKRGHDCTRRPETVAEKRIPLNRRVSAMDSHAGFHGCNCF
jgi:hypothetical protein